MTSTTPNTQAGKILDHLTHRGPITAMDALNYYGCFRLAARIKDLRDAGHDIKSSPTRTHAGRTIAEYTLRQPTQTELF